MSLSYLDPSNAICLSDAGESSPNNPGSKVSKDNKLMISQQIITLLGERRFLINVVEKNYKMTSKMKS